MSALTDLRLVIMAELEKDLGIEFFGGIQAGPIADRDIGFVWVSTLSADADNTSFQYVDVRVRVFKRWREPQGYNELDPTEIETVAEQLQTALADIKASVSVQATGFWFLTNMPEVELDPSTNGVEASVLAARQSPFLT